MGFCGVQNRQDVSFKMNHAATDDRRELVVTKVFPRELNRVNSLSDMYGAVEGDVFSVHGIPINGLKSRVETQVKFTIRVKELGKYSKLKICEYLTADKVMLSKIIEGPEVVLMKVKVVCAKNLDEQVFSCNSCIERERRNTEKKFKRMKEFKRKAFTLEEELERIVVFHSSPVFDISSGSAMISSRLTCYCRHHQEKEGFKLKLQFFNYQNQLLESLITPAIMVTDDHKSKSGTPKRTFLDEESQFSMKRNCYYGEKVTLPSIHALTLLGSSKSPFGKLEFSLASSKVARTCRPSTQLPMLTESPIVSSISPSIKHDKSFISVANLVINLPKISHIIPYEGSVQGNQEICILGDNFHSNIQVIFGNRLGIVKQVHSATSMIVVVPPAMVPGAVKLKLKLFEDKIESLVEYRYLPYCDVSLYESAMKVLALKLNGTLSDPLQMALRIINEMGSGIKLPLQLEKDVESIMHTYHSVLKGIQTTSNKID